MEKNQNQPTVREWLNAIEVDLDGAKKEIEELKAALRHQDTMMVKRTRAVVTTGTGENIIVTPKQGDQFVRIFWGRTFGTSIDDFRIAIERIGTAMGHWAHKPGFRIVQPLAISHDKGCSVFSVIIAVDRTHYSQEDFEQQAT